MENQFQFCLPEASRSKIIRLPSGRLISFPFLHNANINGIVINSDLVIESYLFDTPQRINIEIINCEGWTLNGDILTREITITSEKQLFLIHLIQPVEIVTRLLGSFNVRALGIDAACKLECFTRTEN